MPIKKTYIERVVELGSTATKEELAQAVKVLKTLLRARFGAARASRKKQGVTGKAILNGINDHVVLTHGK